MAAPPTGVITFLFTDIEGSTRLLHVLGDRYRTVQDRHGEIIRATVAEDGYVVRTEGDSFFVTFRNPVQAVRAAVTAQRRLASNEWPTGSELRVRMGLHTGQGLLGGDDYIGIDVNTAARIAGAAHGGQVLLSEATRALTQHDLPGGVVARDLGEHRLRDIAHPERLFDLVIDGLPSDFPPIKSMGIRPNNLPLPLNSFIGRAHEVAQAVQLLEGHRLVTLTGPGGSGKTRLALELARDHLAGFEDGVYFVDLAPLLHHEQVPSELVQGLGMREVPGRDLVDILVDRLAAKDVLLVLDNFEHVLPACWVVERLLGSAPRLRILTTSRAPLRIYGEQELAVPPLALPDPYQVYEPRALTQIEAIALFTDRVRAVRPEFVVTDENAAAVAGICARLDGLPLAIELAASRMKVLSPQKILSRLAIGPDLLTATARNLPPRQRTLRATINWSYGLLYEPEQRLFARLSVFKGGASFDAAEAVGNPEDDLGVDTLDALTVLVDNSLVRQTETKDAEPRFGMLETIREYAGELLASGDDAAPARRRHADYFLTLAHDGESHLTTDDQVQWLNRFELEHDNLQATFRWTLDAGEPERGLAAAAAMWRFWQQRGYLSVGRSWLERLLSSSGPEQTATVANGHLAAGSIAYWQGDYDATDQHYRKGLTIFQALGDQRGIAEATYNLAFAPEWDDSLDIAARSVDIVSIERMQDALRRFEELGDVAGVAKAKGNLAFHLAFAGDMESAGPLLEEAIAGYRQLHEKLHLADALIAYGQGLLLRGDYVDARAALIEALGLVHEADNWAAVSGVLEGMSFLESRQGRHERAVRILGSFQEIRRTMEFTYPLAASSTLGIDVVAEARNAIGDEAVDRALAEGRAMTRAEAVAYAAAELE
jgi:predicted ATPase/class 3 adenylate cyclase